MFFGLFVRTTAIMYTLELQAMLAKQLITQSLILPSKEEMMADLEDELRNNEVLGIPKKEYYISNMKGYNFQQLYKDLCKLSSVKPDTLNYPQMFEVYFKARSKLSETGDNYHLKMIDYDKVFDGIVFNPTSDTF